MNRIILSSPAKINLFLEIKGKRPDGYHEVNTWLHTIDLADEVTVSRSDREYSTLRSNDNHIPLGNRNLCIKAVETVKEETGLNATVEITLDKNIPLGSGMGGGSSNAATVINGLDRLFSLGLNRNKMLDMAERIGTDVPFFILGGSAMGSGRGEKLTPLPVFPNPISIVIVQPNISISTGDAYTYVGDYKGEREINIKELSTNIEKGDLEYVAGIVYNAFEQFVFPKYHKLAEVKNKLIAGGCLCASITGSGAAIYGICPDDKTAVNLAESFHDDRQMSFAKACRIS